MSQMIDLVWGMGEGPAYDSQKAVLWHRSGRGESGR